MRTPGGRTRGKAISLRPIQPRRTMTDDDDPEMVPREDQDYEEYELDEPEAIALNSIEELDDTADAGHAIQLQLAANAAFGKAKGKGKRPKGKGKGKGKVPYPRATPR